jgi:hypothetical protein
MSGHIATTALTGSISKDAGTPLQVNYAAIAASGSGNNTLVAAVPGSRIRVLSIWIIAAGSVTVQFQDGAGGTNLSGAVPLNTNTGFVLPLNEHGWFQTTAGNLLNASLGSAVAIAGSLSYVLV